MSAGTRLAALGSTIALVASLGGSGVAAADSHEVRGSILVPVASAADTPHCALTSDEQGMTGWTIDPVTPGDAFTLVSPAGDDFDVSFFASLEDCQSGAAPLLTSNASGDEAGVVPAAATVAVVFLWLGTPGSEFVYTETEVVDDGDDPVDDPTAGEAGPRPTTVVAVIDNGFSPYHYDFVGHQHPWNVDVETANDLDFTADPALYVDGYPGATPLELSLPTGPDDNVTALHDQDAPVWANFEQSTLDNPKMYRFPGTKVIGAISFDGSFDGDNSAHGTRSAASAAGNLHGTCPECLFVLVKGFAPDALEWVSNQPWIDVVTNSYGHSTTLVLRDNIYFDSPVHATQAAAEDGKTIVFSAGNGLANAFDVPMFTYWSSEKGPDWMVTTGAVDPDADQTYSGAGKPVDIASYGLSYPSTGGTTATGEGAHSGTSNAAPTVAGTIARVIQQSRELLGDTVGGHADGVVARVPDDSGPGQGRGKGRAKGKPWNGKQAVEPFTCGDVNPGCVLEDGILTAVEARQVVFENVLPSDLTIPVSVYPTWPSTEFTYYYQGHGVVHGRLDEAVWAEEQAQFTAALTGAAAHLERPPGEQAWMEIDSFCRQRLWGTWSGGYHDGESEPAPSLTSDPLATMFLEWCSQVPQDFFRDQT